jgi:histidine triad (HIT) family protein
MSDAAVECIFCRIIGKEIPGSVVTENESFLAIADINPQAPVHILIMPKPHIPNITKMVDAELTGRLFGFASEVARLKNLSQGFRLVINTGVDGGQTVDHLHIHLLGGRTLNWPPG